MTIHASTFDKLTWRCIGPPRGGRVVAVAGHPTERATFWFGACAGGVWKTTDGGTYWENVSDGFFRTQPVGAIAVSTSDPNVVYAGMGESCVRNDVVAGDGVYRSTDGGRSWQHLGLAESRHVSRVRVHPSDPDTAYVAALGDIFGPSEHRGVYRTTDGGKTWDHVLRSPGASRLAGAADLWLDPQNPRLLYAAIWQAQRRPWLMESGGPDSGLFRSTDGGASWTDISRHPGLPKKAMLGRIGVCASPAPQRNNRVWALVEAGDGESGLYVSEDFGDTWRRASEDKAILGRPWYYSHIVPDPQDAETIYAMNFAFWRSTDGGRTFREIPTPHGDNHDVWIDPADPRRMIEGNDGGACVSYNGGETFSTIYNQPTGQFYHLTVDDRMPYRVYGTQQDNSAIRVPSRSRGGAITWSECDAVGHSESGHIAVDPTDHDVVFSGAVGSAPGGGGPMWRYDHASGQSILTTVWPESWYGEDMTSAKHRFPWTYPISFSPHDPGTLYACGERVFRSTDAGLSWEALSDDLTRNDPDKQRASGGAINKDTSGAEIYCTIFAFTESPHEAGVFWAGSDDGLVHLSRDGGGTWKAVTPTELPEWSTVAVIEVSPHDPATAYLCAHLYRLQDNAPYVFRTNDYGETWTAIVGGLPADEWVRMVRADPERRGLLYAGTERGVWVSFDDGGHWTPLAAGLPPVPVYDLAVKEGDLVAASHGRGFWIFDHLHVLRAVKASGGGGDDGDDVELFVPPSVWRYPTPPASRAAGVGVNYLARAAFRTIRHGDGRKENRILDGGTNPADGVTVAYRLPRAVDAGAIELRFLDASGDVVVRFRPDPEAAAPPEDHDQTAPEGSEGEGEDVAVEAAEPMPAPAEGKKQGKTKWWERLPNAPGLNLFTWDLHGAGILKVPDRDGNRETSTGFYVPTGEYTVELDVEGTTYRGQFTLVLDPASRATDADVAEQYALVTTVRDRVSEINAAIGRVRALTAQAKALSARADATDDVRAAADAATKALGAVESRLTQPKFSHDTDRLKLPGGLDAKMRALTEVLGIGDTRPTQGARDVFAKLSGEVDDALAQLARAVDGEVAALNAAVASSGMAAVTTT